MSKKNLFLHIGYPKTGCTTMHECISLNIQGIKTFIPNVNFKFLQALKDPNITDENHQIKQLLENFNNTKFDVKPALNTLLKVKQQDIFISTTGPLSALFFLGHYTEKGKYITPEEIAKRLADIFSPSFNVRIIVTIRKQSDWIPSAFAEWYHYYSRVKGCDTFKDFLTCFKNSEHLYYQGIDYLHVLKPFEHLFGRDNIFVGIFEQLKADPEKYYTSLITFMGGSIDHDLIRTVPKRNVRATKENHKQVTKLNLSELIYFFKLRAFPNISFNMTKRFPWLIRVLTKIRLPYRDISKTIIMSDDDIEKINNVYKNTNSLLSEHYQLQLDKYGYY